jgi:hypothetical protein
MNMRFMDTYGGHVHDVDMNGHNQTVTNQFASFAANVWELGYGG